MSSQSARLCIEHRLGLLLQVVSTSGDTQCRLSLIDKTFNIHYPVKYQSSMLTTLSTTSILTYKSIIHV
ncbi:unnamed protein product [Ixodes pacificus]